MQGIQFLVDSKGRKKAVQIDLARWGKIWEDFFDILVSKSRENEPTISWDELKKEMKKNV